MLHIHRAERADALVEALGAVVADPLEDPMAGEVVAVPTRGVERWLTQRLAARLGAGPGGGDGVCANIDFPFPGRLVGEAVAAATGIDRAGDPWFPERSVWPLLDVVDAALAEPWLGVLARHLGGAAADADPLRRNRRFGAVRHVADLYDRYGVHRPEMLRAWADGADADGAGATLPEEAAWQAELWRRLRERIGHPSPAERLDGACVRLREEPALVDLPRRVSLFGLTRLPASYLDVLRALAAGRDVHLFLLHPSPVLWDRIAGVTAGRPPVRRRSDDPTAGEAVHPLLASWGGDAREMQLVVGAGDGAVDHHHPLEEHLGAAPNWARSTPDTVVDRAQIAGSGAGATLLQRLQADVRADRPPPGLPLPGAPDGRALLDPNDRSLQVHACHGRARQVEVVRDAILHVLAEDPSLEARDVIVMCPDVETFAPLIHATFGAAESDAVEGDGHTGAGAHAGDWPAGAARPGGPSTSRLPDLHVRLADRSLRQTNPVLGVVADLLDLAAARVTGPEILDLAAKEPVRRRFRLDDSDLARLEEWVAATGIRWGLDAGHRAAWSLERVEANTWKAGLDRILLGVAMADEEQRLVGGVLPLDDVESGAIDLAGRCTELVDRLGAALTALARPQPLAAWAAAIAGAADALTATAPADAWQGAQLRRLLDDMVTEATGPSGDPHPAPLELAEVTALLADRLRGRPTRANFRTGHLTICTLVPMRSVPHRVVCLLGLDDATFPRRSSVDGDDLIARHPCVGDRDARTEDRQLLLDAVLAATDRLVVTYRGRDERTNAEQPPAVPVGELLDVVDRTVTTGRRDAGGEEVPARSQVVVHHPLQPFDPRNFTSGAGALLGGDDGVASTAGAPDTAAGAAEPATAGPWSFDPVALAGARALTAPRRPRPQFLAAPLPPAPAGVVELDDLVAFVSHPTRAFLRFRLGFTLASDPDELSGALPLDLDALEEWGVGQRLLDARLAGATPEAAVAAEVARGVLPPGVLAHPVVDQIGPTVEELLAQARAYGAVHAPTPAAEQAAERSDQVRASAPTRTLPLDTGAGDDAGRATGAAPDVGSTANAGAGPRSAEVHLRLPGDRLLVGTVAGVTGDVLRTLTYSRVGARQRLSAWVRFLALSAAHPERPVEAVTVGRCRSTRSRRRVTVARLTALTGDPATRAEIALRHLEVLADLFDRGMREPLPLYCKTSCAWAEGIRSGTDARSAGADAWESAKFPSEDKELEHRLVLGGVRPFAQLLEAPPRPDESGAGWAHDEDSRFGRYARRLWDPLLAHERVVDR